MSSSGKASGGAAIGVAAPQTVGSTAASAGAGPAASPEQHIHRLGVVPSALYYNNANISVPDNTETATTFNSNRYVLGGVTLASSSRVTVPIAGRYLIVAYVQWAASAAGTSRVGYLKKNGATYVGRHNSAPSAAFAPINLISAMLELAASDYVELNAYQDSGGNLNSAAVAEIAPGLAVHWLGP